MHEDRNRFLANIYIVFFILSTTVQATSLVDVVCEDHDKEVFIYINGYYYDMCPTEVVVPSEGRLLKAVLKVNSENVKVKEYFLSDDSERELKISFPLTQPTVSQIKEKNARLQKNIDKLEYFPTMKGALEGPVPANFTIALTCLPTFLLVDIVGLPFTATTHWRLKSQMEARTSTWEKPNSMIAKAYKQRYTNNSSETLYE